MKLYIFLGCIILILGLVIYAFIPSKNKMKWKLLYKSAFFDDMKFKSGDIILFSSKTYNIFIHNFGHYMFNHMALVLKVWGVPYIIEMGNNARIYPNSEKMKGALFSPLEDRILGYPGDLYLSRKKVRLTKPQKKILCKYARGHEKYVVWWQFIGHLLGCPELVGGNMCGQWIAKILYEMGVHDMYSEMGTVRLQKKIVDICVDDQIDYEYPIWIIHKMLVQK